MTNEQLSQPRSAKWGKVVAALCAGILIVALIGLVVIQQPIVIVKVIASYNRLNIITTALIGLGTTAFVLMLMAVAIADIAPHKRVRRFVIGFIGWPILNVIAGIVAFVIGYSMTAHCRAESSCGFGEGFAGLLLIIVIGLITNIGILIFLAVTRRWWIMTGMVTAFVVVGTLYVNQFGWRW